MSDRQDSIYGATPPPSKALAIGEALGDAGRQRRWSWRDALILLSALGSVLTALFVAWANFGHLVLPPRYTFPVIFGTRQGITTGETEAAAAKGKAEAANYLNLQTARSEARKQAVVLAETTAAKAAQEARVQAEIVQRTATLQATAECIKQVRVAAAKRRAECIGTGTAGSECEARGDLVEQLESQCGSLDQPAAASNEGVQP